MKILATYAIIDNKNYKQTLENDFKINHDHRTPFSLQSLSTYLDISKYKIGGVVTRNMFKIFRSKNKSNEGAA